MLQDIGPVCVIGAGAMGGQIALVCALAGYETRLMSRSQERLEAATENNRALLQRRVEKGKLDADQVERVLSRIATGTDLAAAARGAGMVIESVVEDRDSKRSVFTDVCDALPEHAILASNSSTLASSMFTDCVDNPERLLNMHFFNPPLLMPLVEVVRGPHTSQEVVQRCMDFARDLGKQPVLVEKESYGFIANRILFIAMQEAFRLVEEGYVSMEDCDLAVRNGLGWPLGPFELADLVGLDVTAAILEEGAAQTGEERWKPTRILTERVERGELGRKAGRGFRVGD